MNKPSGLYRFAALIVAFPLLFVPALMAGPILLTFTGNAHREFNDASYDPDSLNDNFIGTGTVSFILDPGNFALSNNYSFPTGTGREWSAITPTNLNVNIAGDSYSGFQMTGVSMFDQPLLFDQWNFLDLNGNLLIQWNDTTSSAFSNPLPTDFLTASQLFIEQISSNAHFQDTDFLLLADYSRGIEITIRNPNLTINPVPENPSHLMALQCIVLLLLCGYHQRGARKRLA